MRTNFQVDFCTHVYFQPTIHCSQNLVDFLPLSMPFCAFGAKRHGTGKISSIIYQLFVYPSVCPYILLFHQPRISPLGPINSCLNFGKFAKSTVFRTRRSGDGSFTVLDRTENEKREKSTGGTHKGRPLNFGNL